MVRPPLVSCVMVTYNRRKFVPQALENFVRQTYPLKELVVVDDGTDPIGDLLDRLPDGYGIGIRRPPKLTVGAKRNLGLLYARGDVVTHWDDDDYQAPERLAIQVEALLASGKEVVGTNHPQFYDLATRQGYRYSTGDKLLWLSGSTLMYYRDFGMCHGFRNKDLGEDNDWLEHVNSGNAFVIGEAPWNVAYIHPGNTSPRDMAGEAERRHFAPWPVKVPEGVERLAA